MAKAQRSFNSLAKASATAISFKQLNIESAPAQRPEVIVVMAQYQTGKTGILDYVPFASDGTLAQATAKFGTSPLYYSAERLFPKSGGSGVPVLFVPVAPGAGATAATATISSPAVSFFDVQQDITLAFKEMPLVGAVDAAGKIAANVQLNPASSSRGTVLDTPGLKTLTISIPAGTSIGDYETLVIATINAEVGFPYTAASIVAGVGLTSKWAGVSSSLELFLIDADGDAAKEVPVLGTAEVIDIVDEIAGTAGTYDVDLALANLVVEYNVTRLISKFDADADLDKIQAWGEGQRAALYSQYAVSYIGREFPESGLVAGTVDVTAVKTFGDGRRLDPVNSIVYCNYGDLREMDWTQHDTLLKAGVTHIGLRGGVYNLRDVVTFYHPLGEDNAFLSWDKDATIAGNIAYDQRAYFDREDWQDKAIVADTDKTSNPIAIDIKDVEAAFGLRATLYEDQAWIASADFAKENSVFSIDDLNADRINANTRYQISGTLRIIDITNFVGRYAGVTA